MRRVGMSLVLALVVLAGCGQATQSAPDAAPPPSATTQTPDAQEPPPNAIFCAEVARRVTPEQCDTYQKLAQSAMRGMAAFNAPNPMQRGEARTLQLAIAAPPPPPPTSTPEPTRSEEQLDRPSLSGATNAGAPQTPSDVVNQLPGQTVEFKPLVGRFMRAELAGAGFEITKQSPEQQEVTNDSVTTWTWQVVARQGGDRSLTLTTVVVGCTEGGGECVPLRSTTQNYTVRVAVAPLDQAKDFLLGLPGWIKILSGVIAALAGLLTAIAALRGATRKNA
ncbi:MAG: hypothetical protein QM759_08370 [Terricaulis sp.]